MFITVVVADSEKANRALCASLLKPEKGIRVVAEARNGLETIAATTRYQPRVLLLGLGLAAKKGLSILPALCQKSPRTQVLLLTNRHSAAGILNALSHGARGYLEHKALRTFLHKAVRVVDAGEAWVPRKMVAKILERLARLTLRHGARNSHRIRS